MLLHIIAVYFTVDKEDIFPRGSLPLLKVLPH